MTFVATVWTPARIKALDAMMDADVPASVMARELGLTVQQVRNKMSASRERHQAAPKHRIPEHVLTDRDRRMNAERDLSSILCGDPAPGQSALDRKRASP